MEVYTRMTEEKYYNEYLKKITPSVRLLEKYGVSDKILITPKNDRVYDKPMTVKEWLLHCHYCKDKYKTPIHKMLYDQEIEYKVTVAWIIVKNRRIIENSPNFDIIDILYNYYTDVNLYTPMKKDTEAIKESDKSYDEAIVVFQLYDDKYGIKRSKITDFTE